MTRDDKGSQEMSRDEWDYLGRLGMTSDDWDDKG